MRGLSGFLILLMLAFVVLAIAVFTAWRKFGAPGLWAGLACYTLAWMLAELVIGLMFYTHGTFTVKNAGGDDGKKS